LALAIAWLGFTADEGRAWVPPPERLAGLVADQNRAAQRATKLRLAVQVKGANGQLLARGEAVFEPNGRARLDLEYADGHRELHERRGGASRTRVTPPGQSGGLGGTRAAGSDQTASAAVVETEISLLPPLGLLQAINSASVLGALRDLGGDPTRVALGLDRGRDCWVLGGRTLGNFDMNEHPALWIDLESKTPVRIDVASSAYYRLGPQTRFGSVEIPGWYEVAANGQPPLRVEIEALATPTP